MAIRSLTQIIQDAITYLTGKRPTIATFVGSVVRDVVIESPAQEFDKVYQELAHTQQLQSLAYASSMTEQELDDFAFNFGMTRLAGVAATGTITFQVRNFSTLSGNINIAAATVVSTTGTSSTAQVQFQTSQAATMQSVAAPSYFNPATGLYEITVPIVAQTVGTESNVPAGTITNLLTSIPGVDFVINTVSTAGGQSIESNEAFAVRIQTKLAGNNVGTRSGIESLVRENANVKDVSIVTPNDLEMLRNEFGGAVDVYILGQVTGTTTEAYLYTSTGPQTFIPLRQPALSINSVTGLYLGSPYTFQPDLGLGGDYKFILDPTTLYNGSTLLQNKIVFNAPGAGVTLPDNNTNIQISYNYDSLIQTLQGTLDANENHIVTSNILIKQSVEARVDVYAEISILPGYTEADAITSAQTAVSNYINSLMLGDSINRSDIVGVLEGLASVDQVNLGTLVLQKNLITLPLTQQKLLIAKTEYPRAYTVTVVVI